MAMANAMNFAVNRQGVRDLDRPVRPTAGQVNVGDTERAISGVAGAMLAGLGPKHRADTHHQRNQSREQYQVAEDVSRRLHHHHEEVHRVTLLGLMGTLSTCSSATARFWFSKRALVAPTLCWRLRASPAACPV